MVTFINRGWKNLKSYINFNFGIEIIIFVSRLQSESRTVAHLKNDITFLRRCKKNGIVPEFLKTKHLTIVTKKTILESKKLERIQLAEAINENYRKLIRLEKSI